MCQAQTVAHSQDRAAGTSVRETGPNARLGEPPPHPGPVQGSLPEEKPLAFGSQNPGSRV